MRCIHYPTCTNALQDPRLRRPQGSCPQRQRDLADRICKRIVCSGRWSLCQGSPPLHRNQQPAHHPHLEHSYPRRSRRHQSDLEKRGLLDGVEVVGCRTRSNDIPHITRGVDEGDVFKLGDLDVTVWRTEGHIDGHLSFLIADFVFCGDTMFSGGCGYLFDGPPAKMHASLQRSMLGCRQRPLSVLLTNIRRQSPICHVRRI